MLVVLLHSNGGFILNRHHFRLSHGWRFQFHDARSRHSSSQRPSHWRRHFDQLRNDPFSVSLCGCQFMRSRERMQWMGNGKSWCDALEILTAIYLKSYLFVLNRSRDKFFKWHCSESGQAYGSYMNAASPSWLTSLAFDEISKYAFLGDLNGQIVVLKLLQGQVFESPLSDYSRTTARSLPH